MNDKVATLSSLPKVDHAEQIAAGMEQIAGEIRRGELPCDPTRCVIILAGRDFECADDLAIATFGGGSSTPELVGLLELVKLNAAKLNGR